MTKKRKNAQGRKRRKTGKKIAQRAPTREMKKRGVFAFCISFRGKDYHIAMKTLDWTPLQQALLPKGRRRWRYFGLGAVAQVLLLLILVSVPLLFPDTLPLSLRQYLVTKITPPEAVSAWKPVRLRHLSPVVAKVEAPPVIAPRLTLPTPITSAPTPKNVKNARPADAPGLSDIPKMAPLIPISSVIPNLTRPREPVQTGGFGEPRGLPPDAKTPRTPNVPQLGKFDLAPGAVRATGRSPRVSGNTSAGFGNGTVARGRAANTGTVRPGLFANDYVPASRMLKQRKVGESAPSGKPVEILFKPRPVYTELARAKKIEGEVLLEVAFSTSGQARVLRVIQGLGYGLDQSAEEAVGQIRFRPAQSDQGVPIDSTAVIHIVFELAY